MDLYTGFFRNDFPKMSGERGGGAWPFGIFPKIHPFWWRHPSLILTHTSPNKHESEYVNSSTFVAHYQHLGFEILLVSRKKVNRKEKNTQTIRNEITLF